MTDKEKRDLRERADDLLADARRAIKADRDELAKELRREAMTLLDMCR